MRSSWWRIDRCHLIADDGRRTVLWGRLSVGHGAVTPRTTKIVPVLNMDLSASSTQPRCGVGLAYGLTGPQKEDAMLLARWMVTIAWFLVLAQPSHADSRDKMIGTWKLVSQEVEIQATGEKAPALGKSPTGYAIFTAEGRMMTVITADGRKSPTTVQERADLLNNMVAYTGKYRLEGDKWITAVDAAWNPEWVDTEQTRFFKIEGDRLEVVSQWRVMPNWPEKGMQRSILVWEKVK
jgi:Lipocalin-like domain